MQPAYLALRGKIDSFRDKWAPVSHTSTFRSTGQITPEEFVLAGDYLVYKFPTWSWASAGSAAKSVNYLPPNKQYLVTRGVPCHRRLDDQFAGGEERVVRGGEGFDDDAGDGEAGWLSTGGDARAEAARMGDVRTLGDRGEVMEDAPDPEEEEIPDMDDDEDDEEAIIREAEGSSKSPLRTYTLYITYTPYYRTPRLYLSGYLGASTPLPPNHMLEDIVGDYKDKTVTFEDFPFFDPPLKTASVHPCRHAAVMKLMLDRADAALKLRNEKLRKQHPAPAAAASRDAPSASSTTEVPTAPSSDPIAGLVDAQAQMTLDASSHASSQPRPSGQSADTVVQTPASPKESSSAFAGAGHEASGSNAHGPHGDEWEVLQHGHGEGSGEGIAEEPAIRVDQYMVVFLKFIASVTPGIEHDFTMGV